MSDDNGNGKAASGKAPWVIGGSSVAGLAVTVLWSQLQLVEASIDDSRKAAATALQVAAQHGEEFNAIRRELNQHLESLANLRAQMNVGGRFTSEQGRELGKRIHELERELLGIQRQLSRHNVDGHK